MSLFDRFRDPDKKEEKKEIARERRHTQMAQSQVILDQASKAEDDQMYHAIQDARSDFLKWQQELGEELADLVLTLKGIRYDESGKLIVIDEEPICNEDFINKVVIPQCKPFMSKNLINSKLDEARILSMLRMTANEITDAMADAWTLDKSAYAIKFEHHDLVLQLILNVITPSPFRALKGWTKTLDNTAHKRIEAYTERPEGQDKKGMFALFKGG